VCDDDPDEDDADGIETDLLERDDVGNRLYDPIDQELRDHHDHGHREPEANALS
jgi:hypothetical protein